MLIPDGCTGRIQTTNPHGAEDDGWEQELVHDGPCPTHPTPAEKAAAVAAGYRAVAEFFEAHPALAAHVTPGGSIIEVWNRPSLAPEFVDGADPDHVSVYEHGLVRAFGPVEVRLFMNGNATRNAPVAPPLKTVAEVLADLPPATDGEAAA